MAKARKLKSTTHLACRLLIRISGTRTNKIENDKKKKCLQKNTSTFVAHCRRIIPKSLKAWPNRNDVGCARIVWGCSVGWFSYLNFVCNLNCCRLHNISRPYHECTHRRSVCCSSMHVPFSITLAYSHSLSNSWRNETYKKTPTK